MVGVFCLAEIGVSGHVCQNIVDDENLNWCCPTIKQAAPATIKDCWLLLDSGPMVHTCNDERIIRDKRTGRETVLVGNGTAIVATVSGMVTLTTTVEGKVLKLTNELYVPEFKQNIISFSRIIDKVHYTFCIKVSENA